MTEQTLTHNKLVDIFSRYDDKEALNLIPESQVNSLSSDPKHGEIVGGAIKWVSSRKIAVAHVTTCAESAATWSF